LVLLLATVLAGTLAYLTVIWGMNYEWQVAPQTQYLVTVYNPLLRFSEFAAGCIAGHWFLRALAPGMPRSRAASVLRSGAGRNVVVGLCLLAIAARIATPAYTGPSSLWWMLDGAVKYSAFIVPFVGLVLAVASGPTWLSPLLERPWMVLLGEASYALYIIHWSLVTVFQLRLLGEWGTPTVHAAGLLATVLLSVLCYRLVEVPMRQRLRGRPAHDNPRLAAQPLPRPATAATPRFTPP
jgi:peptidoglycan/LPS O-acetylase OafA/YrhL